MTAMEARVGVSKLENRTAPKRKRPPTLRGARPGRLADLAMSAILRSDRLDALALPLQRALARVAGRPKFRRAKDFLNGTWLGHPLHPALTDVPIGAWTVAVVFDALTVTRRSKLDRAAE